MFGARFKNPDIERIWTQLNIRRNRKIQAISSLVNPGAINLQLDIDQFRRHWSWLYNILRTGAAECQKK